MTYNARKALPKLDDARAQAVWHHARGLPSFGYKDIAAHLRVTVAKAQGLIEFWELSGVLDVVREKGARSMPAHWRIKSDCLTPPVLRSRTSEDNLWTAMRRLADFSPTDLMSHASTEELPIGLDAANAYCRALLSAGYFRVVSKAKPGVSEARYKLIKNTGPKGPLIRRVRALVDLNTEAVVVLSEVGQ